MNLFFVCLILSVKEFPYPPYICRLPSLDHKLYPYISLCSRWPARYGNLIYYASEVEIMTSMFLTPVSLYFPICQDSKHLEKMR